MRHPMALHRHPQPRQGRKRVLNGRRDRRNRQRFLKRQQPSREENGNDKDVDLEAVLAAIEHGAQSDRLREPVRTLVPAADLHGSDLGVAELTRLVAELEECGESDVRVVAITPKSEPETGQDSRTEPFRPHGPFIFVISGPNQEGVAIVASSEIVQSDNPTTDLLPKQAGITQVLTDSQKIDLGMGLATQSGDMLFRGIQVAMENMQLQMNVAFELARLNAKRAVMGEIEARLRTYHAELIAAKSPLDRKLLDASIDSCKEHLVRIMCEVSSIDEMTAESALEELLQELRGHAQEQQAPKKAAKKKSAKKKSGK